jgi:hypothetical protein
MISTQIDTLKHKLNSMIANKGDYKDIYILSVEIDKLIAQFYSNFEKLEGCYREVYYKNV